ncbi:zf-TFIIB domain-containing protein [Pseudoalteromonas luteoviolacea]|uniref:zf-TFIIB domain-containing protein n=1 Tax=Pseudoalteromonas luteoviolacea TaxID=43657 RepID=UPI001B3755D0|nr:zf-TFIIB domain-containing protein [Pseudoalteromonas luteoviolacea]MBQ4810997.1 zf-TFIIB domain-containing protein [Pseudoalteromonas luteoviolacea]
MNCTSCESGTLKSTLLDDAFRAHTCSNCNGHWILIEDFVAWKEKSKDFSFTSTSTELTPKDSKRAKLCPVSGSIMRKFRVSEKSEHRVDYSVAVGGLWLDPGEWELLKQLGVADSLNAIATQQWQNQIREQSTIQSFTNIYSDKFDKADYDKLKEIRAWLAAHPQKADLKAYLMAEDPYSAEK